MRSINPYAISGVQIMMFLALLGAAGYGETDDPVHEITGQVTNEAGEPIAGALVEWGLTSEDPSERDRTRTDAEGRYQLRVSSPGAGYRLAVSAPGYALTWQEYTLLISSIVSDKVVDVVPPDTVDFTLQPAHFLEGIVQDEKGKPIAGATIQLLTAERERDNFTTGTTSPTDMPGDGVFKLVTNASGRFRFDDLPDDAVFLWISAPHYGTFSKNRAVDTFHEITLQGTGKAGWIQGNIVDLVTEQPVLDFTIVPRNETDPHRFVDPEGYFQLKEEEMREGKAYAFYVYALGYAPFEAKIQATPIGGAERQRIALTSAQPLRVRLVNAQGGNAISNAKVFSGILGDTHYFEWPDWNSYADGHHGLAYVQHKSPDSEGNLWFCEDAARPCTLFIFARGYERLILKPEERAQPDADGVLVVSLMPEAKIRGIVAKDGVRQPGITLNLVKHQHYPGLQEHFEQVTTDDRGYFEFSNLQQSEYTLYEFRRRGGLGIPFSIETFTLQPGEQKSLGMVGPPEPKAASEQP